MRGTRGPQQRVDIRQRKPIAPAPNAALILECYCACRWHQRCRFEKSGDFGASPFYGQRFGRASARPCTPNLRALTRRCLCNIAHFEPAAGYAAE
jgi:hypothetical protein